MRFSTLVGGDWHLLGLGEGGELLPLILLVVLSWVLVVSSHACTAQESTVSPGKPSAEIPCLLSAIPSSPVHSPVESVCLGFPRCLSWSSYLGESPGFPSISAFSLFLPTVCRLSLGSSTELLYCHLLCSIFQESLSFFIWCLTSWKLLFHILSLKKKCSGRRSNLVPVIPSWLKVNASAMCFFCTSMSSPSVFFSYIQVHKYIKYINLWINILFWKIAELIDCSSFFL